MRSKCEIGPVTPDLNATTDVDIILLVNVNLAQAPNVEIVWAIARFGPRVDVLARFGPV